MEVGLITNDEQEQEIYDSNVIPKCVDKPRVP